jgi:hypothetical protein
MKKGLTINLSNKVFYTLVSIAFIIVLGVGVFAATNIGSAPIGHDASEVYFVGGESLQAKFDAGQLGGSGISGSIDGPFRINFGTSGDYFNLYQGGVNPVFQLKDGGGGSPIIQFASGTNYINLAYDAGNDRLKLQGDLIIMEDFEVQGTLKNDLYIGGNLDVRNINLRNQDYNAGEGGQIAFEAASNTGVKYYLDVVKNPVSQFRLHSQGNVLMWIDGSGKLRVRDGFYGEHYSTDGSKGITKTCSYNYINVEDGIIVGC